MSLSMVMGIAKYQTLGYQS